VQQWQRQRRWRHHQARLARWATALASPAAAVRGAISPRLSIISRPAVTTQAGAGAASRFVLPRAASAMAQRALRRHSRVQQRLHRQSEVGLLVVSSRADAAGTPIPAGRRRGIDLQTHVRYRTSPPSTCCRGPRRAVVCHLRERKLRSRCIATNHGVHLHVLSKVVRSRAARRSTADLSRSVSAVLHVASGSEWRGMPAQRELSPSKEGRESW
jgi:hypothetical protein